MNKIGLFVLVLAFTGIGFSTFCELTDNVQLEWADNDFQAVDIAVGNIDSDPAYEAVVVGNAGSAGDEMGIAIFELSNGAITFETSKYYTVTSPYDSITATSVILCDVDGDGTKDIVTGGYRTTPMHISYGFVYTYEYVSATITPQYEYNWSSAYKINDLRAKLGSGYCNINAVGGLSAPGTEYQYVGVLNIGSGTLDIYHEEAKSWLTDSMGYGIDFFQDGTVVTTGNAESGFLSTQYVTITKNPGNHTVMIGSTGTNKEGKSVVVSDVANTSAEEIIIGADSDPIVPMYTSSRLYLLDEDANIIDYVSISVPNASMFMYDSYMNDVEVCDVDNDGMKEIFAAMDFDASTNYGQLDGYNAIEIFSSISLLQVTKYDTQAYGSDSGLPAIECTNVDADANEELVSVINVDGATKKIIVAILEDEPQVPVIDVVSPTHGQSLAGGFTATINVTDDSAPGDITAQYRFTSPSNMSGYYQAMNNSGYTFYAHVNLSAFSDGPYVIHFKVTDGDGNVAEEHVNFFVDNSLLTLSMVDPADGSVVRPGRELLFTASQPLASFSYSLDNTTHVAVTGPPYIIDTTGWSEGMHRIHVDVESVSANTASGLYKISIDGTAPIIMLLSPPEGEIDEGQEIAFKIIDAGLDSLVFEINGIPVDYTGSAMPIIIYTNGWGEGTVNTVKVIAKDTAGNPLSTQTFTFTVRDDGDNETAPAPPVQPTEPTEPATPEDPYEIADNAIKNADEKINDAKAEGKPTELAEQILAEAKEQFELENYDEAIRKANAAVAAIGKAAPAEPETPTQPTQPAEPAEPGVAPIVPGVSLPIVGMDSTLLLIIGGAVLAVILIAGYYLLFRKKGEPPQRETKYVEEKEEPETEEKYEEAAEEEMPSDQMIEGPEIDEPAEIGEKPKKKPKKKAKKKTKRKTGRKKKK